MLLYRLEFSLISSRARQLVRSLNFTSEPIEVYIGDFEISIPIHGNQWNMGLSFYKRQYNSNNQIKRKLPPPRFADVIINNKRYKLHKEEFEMKDWLDHLLSVFNCSKIKKCKLATNQYDISSLEKTFNGVDTVALDFFEFSAEDVKGIWNAFRTCETLDINRFVYEGNEEKFQKILMRNYTTLRFFENTTLSLDDLLTINSSHAMFFPASFTEKVLNRFLKHWIKGSNPRLESIDFVCYLEHNFEIDLLLKGIDHKVEVINPLIFDDDEDEDEMEPDTEHVRIEIKRWNGAVATLAIDSVRKFASIWMTVR
ncbi:hypothetical protein CRE_29303 [Caenorhabditis remanei]|uniref:Sdz-33 F-box domain-containing protein n=1 Tax=Caenorhabditis remanei TaxID=31234 RepID=E3MY03_CAERE|nr:hypothetical protein CRE_29303 [Caenorhabditis remanei]